MTPLFHPRLVNGPLGDSALYIDLKFDHRAVLFDLGDVHSLSPRQLLKISHIFISHTHIDHFIGFDHFLRICLGRPKVVHLYGPPNFLDQVRSKLSAYTWNLVKSYPCSLDFVVIEVHPDHLQSALLRSSKAFHLETIKESEFFNGLLHQETAFYVRTDFVNHKIPCLAFSLEERFHINIFKTEMDNLGLSKGPWLLKLKEAIWRGEPDGFIVRAIFLEKGMAKERRFHLGELKDRLVRITPGQKISYVVDTIYDEETRKIIKDLIKGSDYLFMETPFLEEEIGRAREKHHLTARQAGFLAGETGVKRLIPFHVSPKYSANPDRVIQEALSVFRETSNLKKL